MSKRNFTHFFLIFFNINYLHITNNCCIFALLKKIRTMDKNIKINKVVGSNHAEININPKMKYGSFEFWDEEDEEYSYLAGGLWLDGKEIVDFDGCFDLPNLVKDALKEKGYIINW